MRLAGFVDLGGLVLFGWVGAIWGGPAGRCVLNYVKVRKTPNRFEPCGWNAPVTAVFVFEIAPCGISAVLQPP